MTKRFLAILFIMLLSISIASADWKLHEMTEATSPNSNADLLYIVVDPSGTPLDRKMTMANFFKYVYVDGHTTGTNLTAAQVSGTLIHNYGQGANDVQITLPTASAGYSFLAVVSETVGANFWKIKAGASDKIYLDGVAGTDGYAVGQATPTIGSVLSCSTFLTGSSTYDWSCISNIGTWVAGSATYYSSIGRFRVPNSGTDLLQAGTNTTTACLDITDLHAGLNSTDNSLVGVKLYNSTRSASRIITAYDSGTDCATLESAIASQVATDEYYIQAEYSDGSDTYNNYVHAYVDEAAPDTVHTTSLLTRANVGERRWPVLRFKLSALGAASITGVKLWLTDADSDNETITVYSINDVAFTQAGVTWNHQVHDTVDWTGGGAITGATITSLAATVVLNTEGSYISGTHATMTSSANTAKDGWWGLVLQTGLSGYGEIGGAYTEYHNAPFITVTYTK